MAKELGSIYELFLSHVGERADAPAIGFKENGTYRYLSWKEVDARVKTIAMALINTGVKPGDRVCIVAQTRLEWILFDLGILAAGAVTVPIYPSNVADECQYIVDNSGAVVVVTDEAIQTQKFLGERSRLGNVVKVVQMFGDVPTNDGWAVGFSAWTANAQEDGAVLEARRKTLNRNSVVTIIYTSGTTGRPKGAVLTHDNLLYEAEAIVAIDLLREDDIQLLWVPLAHVLGKVLIVTWLATPHKLVMAESMATLKENLQEVRPTMMAGVPRIYEKFHGAVAQKALAAGGAKATLFTKACELSERNGEAEYNDKSLSLKDQVLFAVLKKLVFKKVGQGLGAALGGRIRILISGGAPLPKKIGWFFRDAGVEILEGYGLTETSAATFVNRTGANRLGTVGPAMPGTEVKIASDGEILIKGRGVMKEYWRNPEATREVLVDGFFATGDIGELDKAGYLRITDRKKDIIVTAGGKNVAPQNLENTLKSHPLISQVVVHGDRRKFLSALITLDPDALKKLATDKGLSGGSYAELTQNPEIVKTVEGVVSAFNHTHASFETIKRFKVLEHDFSVESGEMTPSLKIKRKAINERYKAIFAGFYDEASV